MEEKFGGLIGVSMPTQTIFHQLQTEVQGFSRHTVSMFHLETLLRLLLPLNDQV